MSRKVVRFPRDDAARLRGLLAMIERHTAEYPPVEYSREALEAAGFVNREAPPPDRFLGRRILAWVAEREARRQARRRRR
jgi:hypothetical protein